jgi:predicted outer membrane repeat protein
MKSIILYFTIFMMGAASAATFTVTTVNNGGAGSLRRAIEDANAAPGPDTILFDTAGVFATQQAIVLNSPIPLTGFLTITAPVPLVNRVAVRGNAAGTQIFSPSGTTIHLTMTDLVVEDGTHIMVAPPETVVTLTAERCIFRNHSDTMFDFGGGIVSFTDCTFTDNNFVISMAGGSINFNGGSVVRNAGQILLLERGFLTMNNFDVQDSDSIYSPLIEVGVYPGNLEAHGTVEVSMTNCDVTNNDAFFLQTLGGSMTVSGCNFEATTALFGGWNNNDLGQFTFSDCSFLGNGELLPNSEPDGVLLYSSSDCVMEDCLMEDNIGTFTVYDLTLRRTNFRNNNMPEIHCAELIAEDCEFDQGGALDTNYATIRRCALNRNTGKGLEYEKAGLIAAGTQTWLIAYELVMESCTVDGNIGVIQSDEVEVYNCTFSNNTGQAVIVAGRGGSLTGYAALKLQNSAFSGNTCTNSTSSVVQTLSGLDSLGGNFIDATGTLSYMSSGTDATDQIGTLSAPLNALLGPLIDWGDAGKSRMPLAGSPLINAGKNAPAIPAYQEPFLDHSGLPRVTGIKVDIGAIEALSRFTVTNTATSGVGSLRDAIVTATGLNNAEVVFDPTVFATPQTIILVSPILVTGSVKIIGPAVGVAVSGGNATKLFNIQGTNIRCEFQNIHFTRGEFTGDGGAMKADMGTGGKLTLRNCLFSLNHSTARGGALVVLSGTVQATGCLWNDNTCDDIGGGIAVVGPGVGQFTNCTLTQNSAIRGGGGLAADAGQASLINCTITNNTADSDASNDGNGGGLRVVGTTTPLRLGNTVVAENTDASAGASPVIHPDISGAFITLGHNFIGKTDGQSTTAGTPIVHGTLGDLAGSIAAPLSPSLAAMALNGGLFRTRKPNNSSPLIGAGDPALLLVTDWPELPTYDARTQFRTVGTLPDIGAVEALDLPLVEFFLESTPSTIVENQPGSESRYILRRSMPGTAIQVPLSRGSASTASTSDFALGGSGVLSIGEGQWQAFFSASELQKIVTLRPLDDTAIESDETALIFVPASTSYIPVTAPVANRTTTIQSNDILVSNTANSGPGSLRAALSSPGSFTHSSIVFDPLVFNAARTITLTTPLIYSSSSITTVHGPDLALTISGNDTSRLLEVLSGADLTLENINLAHGYGALPVSPTDPGYSAISVISQSSLTLRGCCIRNCRSQASGGAVNVIAFGASFTAENCTFSQNTAPVHGGAIYVWQECSATLTHCTLAENAADTDLSGDGEGGAIHIAEKDTNQGFYYNGTLSIQGCLVTMNTDELSHEETSYSTRARHIALPSGPSGTSLFNGGGNYFSTAFDQGSIQNSDVIASFSGWTSNSANLYPLAFNGGPTMTYALPLDSLARGVSNPSHSFTDQRGIGRDNVSDAGAYNLATEDYTFWASYAFPEGASLTGQLDDYDRDGVTNLMEQFTGTDPTDSASFPTLTPRVVVYPATIASPTEYFPRFTYPYSARVRLDFLEIEASTDLITWQTLPPPTNTMRHIVNGQEIIDYFAPSTYEPKSFYRLKVNVR